MSVLPVCVYDQKNDDDPGTNVRGADGVPRQRARGLMFLTAARDSAGASEKHSWIVQLYEKALEQASEVDREAARVESHKQLRRGGKDVRAAQ